MAVAVRVKTPPAQIHDHLQTGVTRTIEVDAEALERELRSTICGEVRFSAGDRGLYSSDASNYRQVPIGVVIPRDKEDVIQTVAICRRYGVEELIGPETVNTMPPTTLNAFRDHGRARPTLQEGVKEAETALARLKQLGIDLNAITEQLQADGVSAFTKSFYQLLAAIEKKREAIRAAESGLIREQTRRHGQG